MKTLHLFLYLSFWMLFWNSESYTFFVDKGLSETYHLLVEFAACYIKHAKDSIRNFINCIFRIADCWSDITLILGGIKCLDAALSIRQWHIGGEHEKYNMRNIRLGMIRQILQENGLDELYMKRFGGIEMKADILILVATQEEEKSIIKNDTWEEVSDRLEYSYYIHVEKDICFALARGISKGSTDAAIAAGYFIEHLEPKVITMAGFAAGKFGEVSLGDIIVPCHVFNCDIGKQIGVDTVLPEIDDYRIKDKWKQIVERFGESWRKSIKLKKPVSYEKQVIDLLHEFRSGNMISRDDIYDKNKYPNWKFLIDDMRKNNRIEIRPGMKLKLTHEGKR